MATWNSTPDVPHTGGTFNFPQNTTNNDIVYTIEYTDDNGCTASTTYLVPSCDCSAYGFTARTTSLSSDEATNVIIAYTSGFSRVPKWDGNPTWLNGYAFMPQSEGNPIIIAHLDPNTDGQPRTGVAKFTTSDGCVFEATVTQSGSSVFTVDPIIYISADGGTAHGNVISTIGGEPVGFSINNSTLQCPSYNGWTVVANTSNSRIDVTAMSTSSSKKCESIQVVQDQTGRYAVFKIIQSSPTAKNITINLIPSENSIEYTSNYYGKTWYVNWKIYYRNDSSKTAVASGTIGYENKTEGQQATYSSTMHVPNLSMPITEYYVDFTTTKCSIYKANHQLVTPPSICYEGDYVTTYETHMESLDAFYDKGTFNILTSFK